jgi:transcriptional regulator with XRE-family HTH domain
MPQEPKPPVRVSARPGGTPANLGTRLREGRERKGFTVRGLARYVGVSPSLVSQIERGRVMPSVGTLYTIANELELLVDDLFRDAGAPREERIKTAGDAVKTRLPLTRRCLTGSGRSANARSRPSGWFTTATATPAPTPCADR